MVATQISGSLIVRDKNLLMIYNEKTEKWNVPSGPGKKGELSAETAERLAEEHTGCDSVAERYMGKLKTDFETSGEKKTWQPYMVEIEGSPEKAEWKKVDDLTTDDVAQPLNSIMGKLKDKF